MSVQQFFSQHKIAILAGIGGLILVLVLMRKNTSGGTTSKTTLDTLHTDLSDIDSKLSKENNYLSSGASMAPLSPEGSVPSIEIMAPGATTLNTPAHTGSGPGDSVPYQGVTLAAFPGDQNDFEGLN
jgi:hypothetical protein